MYYIDNNSGSPNMPPLSPAQSNIPTWFTEGDKDKGISWIGQDWLNILQAELLNILSEAGIKPDKGKLNQLTLSIKAIITANAYTQANNLKEIFDAGVEAQAAARGHLGLGRLATKDSLGPADVNALAKDQNLNDVPDKAKARTALQLGNSATRNVGTTANTVAAGDDARIIATKKAIDETQTGLAAQGVMWITSADDLSNLPSGARRFAINNTGVTVLPTADYFFIEVLAKRDTANGSCVLATSNTGDVWMGVRYTVPNDAAFTWIQLNQNVQNLGLTEAVNRALNAVQKTGDTMTGNLYLKSDNRMHFAIANEDGNARMWLYKDKGGDGVRLNNGVDGGGEFVFGNNGQFYSPSNLHAGGAILANDGNVYGSLWGNQYISAWLNSQFAARDNNINVRATIDWVKQNFVQNIDLTAPQTIQFWDGKGYPRTTDGAAMYNFQMVGGSSNVGWFEVRYTRKFINDTWHVIN
ncbi:hypothetical protein GIT06_00655 [Salmonella enterica]|nr:hypothetical protein [Salmonella enterica]EDX5251390.1 hypothetical protein [Salmonella enterica subsp. enterica serovar Norwich]EAQ9488690.1 hypothetical protein [Salmonella enterica]EBD6152101.1 hypothetical protein [Salmonella enterica]EBJ9117751.1 hypothetical protein [Salmonella enterica]